METKNIGQSCNKCTTILTQENISCKGRVRKCKSCYNAYHKTMFQKHKDNHRKLMYSWRKKNKDKVKQMLINTAVKKHGSLSKSVGFYMKKYKDQLTDTYVKFTLIKQEPAGTLKFADIPDELVQIQRKSILLKRKIQNYV